MVTNEVAPAAATIPLNVVIEESIVPFRGTVLSTQEDSVQQRLLLYESVGLTLSASIEEIIGSITDQASYDEGCERLKKARQFISETDEFLEPIRGLTYSMYQRVLGRKKSIQGENGRTIREGVLGKIPLLTAAIVKFEKDREAEAAAQQRADTQRQKDEHQEQNLEAAIAAEAAGLDEKSVEQIMTQPSSAPTPPPRPTFQRAAGTSRRENWAAEVFDFHALVKHVAKNPSMLPLLYNYDPDKKTSANLNAQAKSLKDSMNVTGCLPGVRAVDKGVLAVRA